MSFSLIISLVAATHFISLMCYSLLKEPQIPITLDEIVNIAPSQSFICNIIIGTTTDCLIVDWYKAKKNVIFLSMDAANKDGNHEIVKIISC